MWGGYAYKLGGDTHINAGGIRISLSLFFGISHHPKSQVLNAGQAGLLKKIIPIKAQTGAFLTTTNTKRKGFLWRH
jgi:hypothetical protein